MAILTGVKWYLTTSAGEGMEKMEPSYTAGGNVNWYSHYGRLYGDFFKNYESSHHMTHQYHF